MLAHPMVPPGHIVVPGSVFQYGQLHASVHHNIMASASANAYRGILARECPGLLQTHAGQPPWNASMVCTGRPPPPETSGASALNPSAPGWGPAMISVPRAGLSGNSVSGWGPAMTSASRAGLSGNSAPRSPSTTRPRDRTPRWKHKAVRNIRSRFPKAYPEQTCPHLGRMSDEAIRALDSDLEQSRNAFLHAREAQRRLSLNTHDVNRTGANESRPDSTTPGVIHTHDVIRLGANESQPDSTITHDVNSNTHDVNRSGAQSRLDSNTHDVNRPEAQSRQNSNTHDVTPDLRKDAPHASERTSQDLPGSPITAVDPELPRPGDHAQDTAHAPRGRVPPSPTTLLIEQAEQGVREAVEGIPGEGILTPLTVRQKHELRAPELTAVPHCTTSHPPVTPPPQQRDRPLLPSSNPSMGSGLADHKPAAVGTGGSESNRASGAAVGTVASPHATVTEGTMDLFEMFMREEETDPSIGALAKTVQKAALAMEAGLPPPFTKYSPWRTLDDGPGRSLCLHQVLTKCCRHLEMPHPPTTSLPQESAQPLSPSTYHTMGDGLADHEPAVAETGGSESSHASEDASKDASKDESETLTPSQKKRIKRKESKAKRDAEVSQRSGVHTRFPDAGVDQTSVLSVSVNAVS